MEVFRPDPRTLDIVESEVKSALGYPKLSVIEEPIRGLVDEAIERARSLIEPVASARRTRVAVAEGEVRFGGDARFVARSRTLARHLAGCEEAFVVAATIGPALERAVRELFERGEFTRASILDAVGSGAVEGLAEHVQAALARAVAAEGLAVRGRYSPGYGDWALADQPWVIDLSGGDGIGIALTETFLMLPRKSITAVIGVERPAEGPSAD